MNDEPYSKAPSSHSGTITDPHKFATFCTWIYLLRVPLGITVIGCALPLLVIMKKSPYQMIRGAYDATPLSFGILLLIVGVLGFSLHMVTHVILNAGHLRYRVPQMSETAVKGWDGFLMLTYFGSLLVLNTWACLLVVTEADRKWTEWLAYGGWGLAGLFMAFLALGLAVSPAMEAEGKANVRKRVVAKVHGAHSSGAAESTSWMARLVNKFAEWFGEGFGRVKNPDGSITDEEAADGGKVRDKHIMVGTMCTGAWVVYIIVGFGDLLGFWSQRNVASINYVLTLLISASWTLTSFTFLLDRYRIPLLSVLVGWVFLTGLFPTADYAFKTQQGKIALTPQDIIGQPGSHILVAAEGGGIHSGSWAAEVLLQLEAMSRDPKNRPFDVAEARPQPPPFSRSVRAVSGVSGGSYGLLFFANAYKEGEIPEKDSASIRTLVRRSSLGHAVHDLVFADMWHLILPLWKTEGRSKNMENAWVEGTDLAPTADGSQPSLASWAEDARLQRRPVVLFNSTGVESGRPVVFGSSLMRDWTFQSTHPEKQPGATVAELTVPVSTGARLSAAFPFISPAARPDKAAPHQRIEHHVDGGYYDNFGVVTLVQWVHEGLKDLIMHQADKPKESAPSAAPGKFTKRLLFIQVRYRDGDKTDLSKPQQGTLYQSGAPLVALYNVRTTGQKLRNNEQFDLFTNHWNTPLPDRDVHISNALFEFDGSAALSWHLTKNDNEELDRQGKNIQEEYTKYQDASRERQALLQKTHPNNERPKQDTERLQALEQALAKLPAGADAYQVMKFLWESNAP